MADGLCAYLKMLWASCVSRKLSECIRCHQPIPKCSIVYRPMTNNKNRGLRLCQRCGDRFREWIEATRS